MLSVSRVIVGACGTPGSLRALRFALELAASQEAELLAVHAWVPPGGEFADRRYPSAYLRTLWEDAAEQRLCSAMDEAWGMRPELVVVHPVIMRGEPGPALVEVASRDGDVLVVGAGRRGVLARLTGHGQVSRYCLSHAHCAVIAVPPADLVRDSGHILRGRPGGVRRFRPLHADDAEIDRHHNAA